MGTGNDGGRTPGAPIDRLMEVVGLLRRLCPWTAALDHAALLRYLVEETYELYEAVDDVSRSERPTPAQLDDLRDELGDLLFQVVLHAQLQAERRTFGLAEVAEGLTDKLVRRNPHVFAADGTVHPAVIEGGGRATSEDIVAAWRAVKEREKPARTSPFDGIPHHLPALTFAAKTLDRAGAARAGEPADPAADTGTGDGSEAEALIGVELLAVIRRAVTAGIDPERALRRAVLDHQRDVLDDW